jgi:hypothetical protein
MAPLGISRHGLTRCPGCKGHVKIAEAGDPPVCPFCATPLSGDTAMSSLMRLASSSRSALIAGALFASPGLAACGDDASDTTDIGSALSDTSGDTASDTASDTMLPDVTNAPLYGGAPGPDAMEDTGSPPPPDDATRAAYGMPPQEDVAPPEPDASTDAQDVAPDDVMRALYGMPPEMPDAEADASDASDASDAEDTGPMPQPVYGAPPPMDGGSSDGGASDATD